MKEKVTVVVVRFSIPVLFLLITVVYAFFTLQAPANKLDVLNEMTGNLGEKKGDPERIYNLFPEIWAHNKEIAFLESRVELAQRDSAGLTINLGDSLLCLELNGICLHAAIITKSSTSRFFSSLDPETYLQVFSKPLLINDQQATLAKEPIVTRIAPKDTAEAAQTPPAADTVPDRPLFVKLVADNGFVIFLCDEALIGSRPEKRYFRNHRVNTVLKNLSTALRFEVPEYMPEIRIYISREDVLSVFRGLPFDASLALKL